MLYTFKSKAAGDLLMLGPSANELLRAIGKAPSATGIIQPADMPMAIRAIEAAIEAAIVQSEGQPADVARDDTVDGSQSETDEVTLRQRAWPFVEMLQRAHAAGETITWGV